MDELRADLESRLGRFEARIGHVQDGVAEARESRARGEGKLDAMLQVLDAERKSRQAYESAATSALASVTEVQRTRALSQIDGEASDRAVARTEIVERRKYRRDIAIKIFAGVAAVWTAISTYLLAR
ncbi:MAG TPA: hypothetical protein VFD36_03265 [Kofleriaceae bacterium]|nr:hypothetical protein [Kofleriaceae bacterium]